MKVTVNTITDEQIRYVEQQGWLTWPETADEAINGTGDTRIQARGECAAMWNWNIPGGNRDALDRQDAAAGRRIVRI